MDKTNALFLHSSVGHRSSSLAFGETYSDSDWHSPDERVVRLLVLLRQVSASAGGLETLPDPELTEILSSAIAVCGLADPIEVGEVIDIVFDAIEIQQPIVERVVLGRLGIGLSDA